MLILVGGLLLLDSLGVIDGVRFDQVWPVVLIGLGVFIMAGRLRGTWRRRS